MHLKLTIVIIMLTSLFSCMESTGSVKMNEWKYKKLIHNFDNNGKRVIEDKLLKIIENNYRDSPYIEGTSTLTFFKSVIDKKNKVDNYIFYIDDVDDILVVYVYDKNTDELIERFYYSAA